jgi:enoyl-CoA hydratase/carnithine racemase
MSDATSFHGSTPSWAGTIVCMNYESLIVKTEADLLRIVLNRPERRNALSLDLLSKLQQALATVPGHVRVVLIEGAGSVFSAGHDIAEMLDRDLEFYERLFAKCTDVMMAIQTTPQPVVAKVHGAATAAGCQLVAACDLAVAAESAWFATPGVRIGLFCSTPMVPVSRAVGRKRALEMLLTGEPIDSATAMNWGLVNRVAADGELETAVNRLVEQITRYSGRIIALGKRAFYRQLDRPQEDAYEITVPIMTANATQPDAQEGMQAFLEKRDPRWGVFEPGDEPA